MAGFDQSNDVQANIEDAAKEKEREEKRIAAVSDPLLGRFDHICVISEPVIPMRRKKRVLKA